ncbi:hypothetical protein DMJ13_25800 [halophilic archaeon]|nr:hypothetical protein DMJ13_25800 [halophilic archaeon]
MEKQNEANESRVHDSLFTAVGTRQRRSILTTLLDRTSITERELALAHAATQQDTSMAEVPAETAENSWVELRHVHLPLLADTSLVAWDSEDNTVTTTDHVAFDDQQFQRLLELRNEEVDEALSGLSDGRRRRLLAILREHSTAMSKIALAREMVQQEQDKATVDQATVDATVMSLSHNHLPKLDDHDLVNYDSETERVAYVEHPGLETLTTLFHQPDNRFIGKFDNFLGGLLSTYTRASERTEDPFSWPASWSDPYYG